MSVIPTKFYDTSTLLKLQERAFQDESPFYINYCTLIELENIKSNNGKDADTKYSSRKLVRLLSENPDKFIVDYTDKTRSIELGFDVLEGAVNDSIILAAAVMENEKQPIIFYTDDLLLGLRAKSKGLLVKSSADTISEFSEYLGYKEVAMPQAELYEFFNSPEDNPFGCLTNEYLVVYNEEIEVKDVWKWNGNCFVTLPKRSIKSEAFGNKIKPKDVYQQMVVDSIFSNQVTFISGGMGAGKTLLSLCTAMNLIDSGKYSRLVALYNPTSTRGATQLGYYSGSMIDKMCQGSLGNILTSKFGDKFAVDTMLSQSKLKIMSMADARGASILDTDILWISESQNTSVDLMKLCLGRVENGAKAIIEGDPESQVDASFFEGTGNGMRRAIDILKGEDLFGYVKLPNVYRSKLAELIQKM